jgi:hypothetical protein
MEPRADLEAVAQETANPTRYVRYHTDPAYATAVVKANWQCQKTALAASEELRQKRTAYNRAYWKERYHNDPEFRASAKARRTKSKGKGLEREEPATTPAVVA